MTQYSFRLLRAARFKLDGGSMFGLVPRAVWSRAAPPDDRGRIPVQHNCLLLERSGPPPAHNPANLPTPKLIIIEVGTGDKLDPKSRDLFDLENRSILDALHEADCRPEDAEAVVVSHLHFDHAGALSRLCRPGESPDWTGPACSFGAPRGDHGVKLTFPNAPIFVQAREWADALANRSTMTRTYFEDHLHPIRSHVRTVDSPRPFPVGLVPDRDQAPIGTVAQRTTEIFPGVRVFLVPGHTWGQQAVMFQDTAARTIVFTPDVMPTINHVGAAYNLGYDVEPYTSMLSRTWFLAEAAANRWTLCLDHEPGPTFLTVHPNSKAWYDLAPAD